MPSDRIAWAAGRDNLQVGSTQSPAFDRDLGKAASSSAQALHPGCVSVRLR